MGVVQIVIFGIVGIAAGATILAVCVVVYALSSAEILENYREQIRRYQEHNK